MIVLITGGSGSGKSAYAEETAVLLANLGKNKSLYYLATMQVYDEESRLKVERHHGLRAGKGFTTIEQPVGILEAMDRMKEGRKTVLLECMSNLVANEMFSSGAIRDVDEVTDKICEGVSILAKETEHLIIVTNNVFEDGIAYEAATTSYMEALGRVNERLAVLADVVTEVVVGIPLPVKGTCHQMGE